MGKKSRLKKGKKQYQLEEAIKKPVEAETKAFLKTRRVAVGKAYRLSYLISMIVNFMVYRSIKTGIQLPSVRPNEEELDENRLQGLHTDLGLECGILGIEFQDVIAEVVSPLAGNEVLMGKVLKKNYDILESLIPSENFRQMMEGQIENPDTWGDSLSNYEERKGDYFEAIKELFRYDLSIVRSDVDEGFQEPDPGKKLAQIKEKYGFESEDFEKLRRRATEFLRVAFANYLEIDFQGVRMEVDARA
jgi:hypothetical protein